MANDFKIKAGAFEGPLDLLLDLIEKRKMFVGDVALAQVADDYLTHIKSLPELPVASVAQFLLVASTLVLIKSRSLIPNLELSPEEEADIWDLETRLKLLERVRALASPLRSRWGTGMLYPKEGVMPTQSMFVPTKSVTLPGVIESVRRVLDGLPKVENLPKALIAKVMSLEDAITDLTKRLSQALTMSFKDFSASSKGERREVVVRFLAMLELVKQGMIDVVQNQMFDEIAMESKTNVGSSTS